jgi:dihydropyrimidine dehydrogenase (NAD+) subunit PreA
MIQRAFRLGWAGAVTKTITPEGQFDRDVSPRIAGAWNIEPLGGLKHVFGLENIELLSDRPLAAWLSDIRDLRRGFPDRLVVASISGGAQQQSAWRKLARACENAGAQAVELNLSCPHGLPERGLGSAIGQDPRFTYKITRCVVEAVRVPVLAKLTPNVTDITAIADVAQRAGAAGISAINTLGAIPGIDLNTLTPLPSVSGWSSPGGYSGPAIKPVALKALADLARRTRLPISAMGGIAHGTDVCEFILLGASTLQVCSAVMLEGLMIIDRLKRGLENFMAAHGYRSVRQFQGLSLRRLTSHARLSRTYRAVAVIKEDLCLRDDLCYIACRDGGPRAIDLGAGRIPRVDPGRCSGCGLCAAVCPVPACISLVPES